MKLIYDNCPNCFAKLDHAEICPSCGFRTADLTDNPNVLPPFTFLNERYLLGRVLGQGGFGITYVAQDILNGTLCAVKEYLPVEYAKRSGKLVVLNETVSERVFEHGKQRFLEEAQTLFNLKTNPTVVQIRDFFAENNTAYLVMEFLDGINLKGKLNRSGGRIDPDFAKVILVTIASSLIEIHRKGILHRDISPENIFLTKSGEIKLIDFGSARSYVSSQKKNGLSVLLKPGFAPPEQYDSHGEQGPWTDVYALAATFYYVVSGQKLPDSLYRQRGEKIIPLAELVPAISVRTSKAIEKALELKVSRRYQNFNQFLNDLDIDYHSDNASRDNGKKKKEDDGLNPGKNDDIENGITTEAEIPPSGEPSGLTPRRETVRRKEKRHKRSFAFWRKKQEIPVVRVTRGRKHGMKKELASGEIVKIGRSVQQCQLALDYDSNISRIHCLLKYSSKTGQFVLMDYSSNNGTFLQGGEKLEPDKSYYLNPGERFYLVSPDNMLEVDLEKR